MFEFSAVGPRPRNYQPGRSRAQPPGQLSPSPLFMPAGGSLVPDHAASCATPHEAAVSSPVRRIPGGRVTSVGPVPRRSVAPWHSLPAPRSCPLSRICFSSASKRPLDTARPPAAPFARHFAGRASPATEIRHAHCDRGPGGKLSLIAFSASTTPPMSRTDPQRDVQPHACSSGARCRDACAPRPATGFSAIAGDNPA